MGYTVSDKATLLISLAAGDGEATVWLIPLMYDECGSWRRLRETYGSGPSPYS